MAGAHLPQALDYFFAFAEAIYFFEGPPQDQFDHHFGQKFGHVCLAAGNGVGGAEEVVVGHARRPFQSQKDVAEVEGYSQLVVLEFCDHGQHIFEDVPEFGFFEDLFVGEHVCEGVVVVLGEEGGALVDEAESVFWVRAWYIRG